MEKINNWQLFAVCSNTLGSIRLEKTVGEMFPLELFMGLIKHGNIEVTLTADLEAVGAVLYLAFESETHSVTLLPHSEGSKAAATVIFTQISLIGKFPKRFLVGYEGHFLPPISSNPVSSNRDQVFMQLSS